MNTEVTAIYENGVLRPLTPAALPERARVRLAILSEDEPVDEPSRAEAALIAAGLIKPEHRQAGLRAISQERRAELALVYAVGGPLSKIVIAERDDR